MARQVGLDWIWILFGSWPFATGAVSQKSCDICGIRVYLCSSMIDGLCCNRRRSSQRKTVVLRRTQALCVLGEQPGHNSNARGSRVLNNMPHQSTKWSQLNPPNIPASPFGLCRVHYPPTTHPTPTGGQARGHRPTHMQRNRKQQFCDVAPFTTQHACWSVRKTFRLARRCQSRQSRAGAERVQLCGLTVRSAGTSTTTHQTSATVSARFITPCRFGSCRFGRSRRA